MQLVSYLNEGRDQLALLVDNMLYDMDRLHGDLPGSMGMFLNYWEDVAPLATVLPFQLTKLKYWLRYRTLQVAGTVMHFASM